jgi:hypothetical protein
LHDGAGHHDRVIAFIIIISSSSNCPSIMLGLSAFAYASASLRGKIPAESKSIQEPGDGELRQGFYLMPFLGEDAGGSAGPAR